MSLSFSQPISALSSVLFRLEERHESGIGKDWERRHWKRLARLEMITGKVSLTSKLRLPLVGTRTG